jgi:O-antigen/teichoic acid export membrane protein
MRIKDHLDKITWSFADKAVMIAFGLFLFVQLRFIEVEQYAFYLLLIVLNNWIFAIADGFALQGVIQFGGISEQKARVNFMALSTLVGISLGTALLFFSFRFLIADFFSQPAYAQALAFLPLTVIATIPKNFIIKTLYRDFKYRQIFWVNFSYFSSQVIFSLYYIFETGGLDAEKMINIFIAGGIVSALVAIIFVSKTLRFSRKGDISFKEFLGFGFNISVQYIFQSSAKNLDFYVVEYFFGLGVGGIYGAAKQMFRSFEEASYAAHGLVYPAAVKLISNDDKEGLRSLLSKSISAMMIMFVTIAIVLNLGLTEFVLNLFGIEKFYSSIEHFNLLVIGGLFLPLLLIGPVLNAMKKYTSVLIIIIISFLTSLTILAIISYFGLVYYIAGGMVSYYLILGILSFAIVRKEIGFEIKDLFRGFSDGYNFIKSIITKKK